jgi:sec-independent protein translocase protein TatC
MASTLIETDHEDDEEERDLGGQMSFLEHLDELRRRLMRAIIFVFVAFLVCWFFSDNIYNFLARPVQYALAEAQQRQVPLKSLTGDEKVLALADLPEGANVRYVFGEATKLGGNLIPLGASVSARLAKDAQGAAGLYTTEPIVAGRSVIPAGTLLPTELSAGAADANRSWLSKWLNLPFSTPDEDLKGKLIVTTAMEPFSLYVKVSLYAAVSLSVPFLLWQIWAFISPGLYPHERSYAVPFILLSSISFVLGAAFAYYVIFPPAAAYLLGLGQDFQLLLKADDYFDFIILVMLAMGVVFQMPAITYVLSRIGLVSAGLLIRLWKTSLIVILAASAILSPTNDLPNMMLFAAPMVVLYLVSIFIAWIFGAQRRTE